MSNFRPQVRQNSADNVFGEIPVGTDEGSLFARFLDSHDLAENSRRAMVQDVCKFARWFSGANGEPLLVGRVTTRDVADFKNWMRRDLGQAVSTVNRSIVTLRRFFGWLVDQDHVSANIAKPVKELRRQQLAPKGMERKDVRRLLREVELRRDLRASAIFHMFLFTGCRIGDLVDLELDGLQLGERSGTFRFGKGNKQRWVPLPLAVRRALQAYLDTRPPVTSNNVFIGERGPLTDSGIRALCDRYTAIIGVKIHPHLLRHTMAHQYLADNPGDLVGLAQILGHNSLDTTARYTKHTEQQLGESAERLSY
jgi:site-specific recombinase XerD